MNWSVALLVKDLACGLNTNLRHTSRALSIAVTGVECQKTGEDLEKIAAWTLGEDWNDW